MPGKKHSSPKRMRCDCGDFAVYRLRVTVFRPDLITPVKVVLYLCEACYQLECLRCWEFGDELIKAVRIG